MADKISIQNDLGIDIKIYDSFSNGDSNYFGKLTFLDSVKANSSYEITPINSPICVLIAFDNDGNPISRYISEFDDERFNISSQDLIAINQAEQFMKFIASNIDSDLTKNFLKLFDDSNVDTSLIDNFFKKNTDYKDCTFVSYMLALAKAAETPATKKAPPEDKCYSLSTLVTYLSGTPYPSEFPDISVKDFTCSNKDNLLKFGGKISLDKLPFESSEVGKNILSLFPVKDVDVEFELNHQLGLNLFGTRISFISNDFNIPVGDGKTITIKKPTVSLDINPLFKFVVFKVSADIPFNIFSHQFNTKLSMVIDNIEAEIGMVIEGDNNALPSPPILKGVHFDKFGVGMGIIFEPPSYALGLLGKFHIGEGNTLVSLDDNTFVVVCSMEGDVPNPLYVSFYVPKLDFSTLVELFTDTSINIDFPVVFEELSFKWAENPQEPIVLPDGTLSDMAFGFSAYMDIFGLKFYGDLEMDMQGISGLATMSPLNLAEIFSLSGDGKAVTIKVDENGNPIKNNQIATTKKEKDAINNAKTQEIVPAGGPNISISTSSSPYFNLSAKASFLELINEQIDATIDKNGISFELDYGAIIESKMKCVLQDFHNFNGDFSYGLDFNVTLPTIAGFNLGSIHVVDTCNLGVTLLTSSTNIDFSVKGGFDFQGININLGPFSLDVNISKVSDIISYCKNYILSNAGTLFREFINEAEHWAAYVGKEIIKGVADVAQGLKTAFNKTANETASIMNSAGFGIDVAAEGIKTAYGVTASALSSALYTGYGATADAVASALKYVGYGAEDVAGALKSVFNLEPAALNIILQGVGYATNEIKEAFEAIGGEFASFASETWGEITKIFSPSKW